MATLEDKILGEKLHNYCSSSESDGEDSDERDKEEGPPPPAESASPPEPNKWEGTSTNTGPKGVISDWQRFKQLETERRTEQELERLALAKKLTLTVQSALDEEREKAALEDPELAELLNDEFLLHYQRQRMQEMIEKNDHCCKFGKVIYLKNSGEFLDAIDKENKSVKVIVHIHEDSVKACQRMNECLKELAAGYEKVKFCAMVASVAGMSLDFKQNAVPALLVYKAGNLIGDYLKLGEQFGDEFEAEDIQGFLIEHGMLEDKSLVPRLIQEDLDDDSD